jgi:hypothetical protein
MSENKVFFAKVKVICWVRRNGKNYVIVDVNSALQTNLKDNCYINFEEFAGNVPKEGEEIEVVVRISGEKVHVSFSEVEKHKKIRKITELKDSGEEVLLNIDKDGKITHPEYNCLFKVNSIEVLQPNSDIKVRIHRILYRGDKITIFCNHVNPKLSFAVNDRLRVRVDKKDKFLAYCTPILEDAEVSSSVSCIISIGFGFSPEIGSELDTLIVYINGNILMVNHLPYQEEKFASLCFGDSGPNSEKIFKAKITDKKDGFLNIVIYDKASDEEFEGVVLAQEITWDSSKKKEKMNALSVGQEVGVVYYGLHNQRNNNLNFSIKRLEKNPIINLMNNCSIGSILEATSLQSGQNKNFVFVKIPYEGAVVEAILHRNECRDNEKDSIEEFSKIRAGDTFSVAITGINQEKQSISISKRAMDYSFICDRRITVYARILDISPKATVISMRGILGVLDKPLIGVKVGDGVYVSWVGAESGELGVFQVKNAGMHNQAKKSKSLSSSLGDLLSVA